MPPARCQRAESQVGYETQTLGPNVKRSAVHLNNFSRSLHSGEGVIIIDVGGSLKATKSMWSPQMETPMLNAIFVYTSVLQSG